MDWSLVCHPLGPDEHKLQQASSNKWKRSLPRGELIPLTSPYVQPWCFKAEDKGERTGLFTLTPTKRVGR